MESTQVLTDTQQAILGLIAERIEAEGMPPSQAEIARAFGFSGVRAAQYHLDALEAAGATTSCRMISCRTKSGCITRIARALPGRRWIAPACSSASRWYCAARTPLNPKAWAISVWEGGTPSRSMRSAIRARMACWVSVRSM